MTAAIVAAGQTTFGTHVRSGVKELFSSALDDMYATSDVEIDPLRIEVAYVGSLSSGQGMQLGNFAPALMDHAGLPPVAALHVESACASGGFALQQAVLAVESGRYRCALAAGVEKMRDVSSDRGRYWLGISGDTEQERLAGITFVGTFALMASRLIADGVLMREDLARVAVKNHRHASHNPDAQLRRPVTLEEVCGAPSIATPLGALDCCPTSDGAACVLVVDSRLAAEFTEQASVVLGWGASTDAMALSARDSLTRLPAVTRAAQQAYKMAELGPEDLDLVEAHDCFTIAELIAYEELGLCDPKDRARCLRDGEFDLGGRLPVNASGGLKAKGHPIGATGVAQVVELHRQLRGQARGPERQVSGARVGLAENVGGSGASACVTILGAAT